MKTANNISSSLLNLAKESIISIDFDIECKEVLQDYKMGFLSIDAATLLSSSVYLNLSKKMQVEVPAEYQDGFHREIEVVVEYIHELLALSEYNSKVDAKDWNANMLREVSNFCANRISFTIQELQD